LRDDDKIQRQVHFMFAQAFDEEDTSGTNNIWVYNRAPEGYKFMLVNAQLSTTQNAARNKGIVAIFDGHEYTHWNLFPGVESREYLGRWESSDYIYNGEIPLFNWECKEYTVACRSTNTLQPVKYCIIVWYYLQKMSWLEKLYYAVIQPKGDRYKKTLGTVAEPSEIPHT